MAAGTMAIVVMTVLTFVVLVSGSVVVGLEASTACGSWPSCSGNNFIPSGDSKFAIHMAHRIVAGLAGLLIIGTAVWTWRMRAWWPGVGIASILLIVLLVGQVDQVRPYMRLADAGLLPSYFVSESYPVALLEALAKMRPGPGE